MCTYARTAVSIRAALAVGLALALLVALPGGARGGEYHVFSCRTPEGQPAPTDGWSEPTHSGEDATLDTCSEAGGGLIAGMDAHVAHPADTDKATWEFAAPPGESISQAIFWRAGEAVALSNPETAYTFWMAGIADSGPETEVFEECGARKCPHEGDFAQPLASENRVVVPQNALGGRNLYMNVSCASLVSACASSESGKAGYAATVELFAADLVLSDTESPVVSGVGGDLAEAPTVSGTSDLVFRASDAGSGIYKVVFKIDGEIVDSVMPDENGGRCRDVGGTSDGLPAFLYTQPCPSTVNVDLPFNAAAVTNGAHHLLVNVLDAAGNATPVVDREITVDNAAAPGGTTNGGSGKTAETGGTGGAETGGASGAGPGGPGGSPGSEGGGSSGPAAAVSNGTIVSAQAILTAAWRGHGGERLASAYGVKHVVEGRLTGSDGAAIVGARIEVEQLAAFDGAKPRVLASPRTGGQGRWRLVLPRWIPSGELRFSYSAHLGDPLPVATRTLTLGVRAGVELRIAPRVARSSGTIRFSGRLLGGPIPGGGKQVVLEARSPGGRWLEFHVIRGRAGAGGRFGFAYRFRLPGPTRYEFRAVCEAEADYPFATGSSNVVRVVEQ